MGNDSHLVLLVGPVSPVGARGSGESESNGGRCGHGENYTGPLAPDPPRIALVYPGWMNNFTRCRGGSSSCESSMPTSTR